MLRSIGSIYSDNPRSSDQITLERHEAGHHSASIDVQQESSTVPWTVRVPTLLTSSLNSKRPNKSALPAYSNAWVSFPKRRFYASGATVFTIQVGAGAGNDIKLIVRLLW